MLQLRRQQVQALTAGVHGFEILMLVLVEVALGCSSDLVPTSSNPRATYPARRRPEPLALQHRPRQPSPQWPRHSQLSGTTVNEDLFVSPVHQPHLPTLPAMSSVLQPDIFQLTAWRLIGDQSCLTARIFSSRNLSRSCSFDGSASIRSSSRWATSVPSVRAVGTIPHGTTERVNQATITHRCPRWPA